MDLITVEHPLPPPVELPKNIGIPKVAVSGVKYNLQKHCLELEK